MQLSTALAAALTCAALATPGLSAAATPAPTTATTTTAPTTATPTTAAATTATSTAAKPVPAGNVRHRVDVDGDGRADTVTFRKVTTKRGLDYFRLAVTTARGATASTTVSTDEMGLPASTYWLGATGIDGVRGNEIVLDLVGGVGDATHILSYAWRGGRLAVVAAPDRPARWPDWDLMWADFGEARGWTFSQSGSTRFVTKHDYKRSSSGRFYGTDTRYRWASKGWQKVATTKVSGLRKAQADKVADLRGLIWR